mmetsp:Transcript_4130/g.13819  ORF Transcript_4130/g.13819 Transcript_4130/m.13819 type:complete len:373 (-) Transcript_4130:332-1450(-)
MALLLLPALLAAAVPGDRAAFEAWAQAHGKTYASPAEADRRFAIWQANHAAVEEAAPALGEAAGDDTGADAWTQGLNAFADEDPAEFARARNGLRPALATRRARRDPPAGLPSAGAALPESVDWREKGVVTPPKDQGMCGSCWAFSAVASIEGQHALATGSLASLSEQNLVDCVHNESLPPQPQPQTQTQTQGASARARKGSLGDDDETCCMGCNGGLMDYAFEYLVDHQHGAIDTEAAYGYKGSTGGACKFNPGTGAVGAKITGFADVPAGDEEALKRAVATVGPISVGVDASIGWQLYFGGVLRPLLCSSSPESMDHGVTVVGYGTTLTGTDYWIIKNSWGGAWGEKGYMRLIRGRNACGIANAASYPLV